MSAWLLLLAAGLFEIGWAVGLPFTQGFTRPLPTVLTLGAMAASVYLLGRAAMVLPIGTAYAVWTGIGAVGVAVLGMAVLSEPATLLRMGSIALIALGIAGLKLAH